MWVNGTSGEWKKNGNKGKEREMDSWRWREEIQEKSNLEIYVEEKKVIKEELMYNRPSSVILYWARTNCLRMNDRNRHQGEMESKLYVGWNKRLRTFYY